MVQRRASLVILAASSALIMANASDDSAKTDPDAVICKLKAKTNTRFPTKTCRTRAQWDAITEQSQRDASEQINRPIINRGDNG